MNYRPITDTWILARPKVKYYGAYPNGFLERARVLLGCSVSEPILHVCGGRSREYPGKRGWGPNDLTLDLDLDLEPDFRYDIREPLPGEWADKFRAIIADPPYTEGDADHYAVGRGVFPSATQVLTNCLKGVSKGTKVGILHYVFAAPRPRELGRLHALITVVTGYDNRLRAFTVFEKT